MSKFHSPDNYWGNMRVDGDVGRKPTYVSSIPLLLLPALSLTFVSLTHLPLHIASWSNRIGIQD